VHPHEQEGGNGGGTKREGTPERGKRKGRLGVGNRNNRGKTFLHWSSINSDKRFLLRGEKKKSQSCLGCCHIVGQERGGLEEQTLRRGVTFPSKREITYPFPGEGEPEGGGRRRKKKNGLVDQR